jgi:hypothetical protein
MIPFYVCSATAAKIIPVARACQQISEPDRAREIAVRGDKNQAQATTCGWFATTLFGRIYGYTSIFSMLA